MHKMNYTTDIGMSVLYSSSYVLQISFTKFCRYCWGSDHFADAHSRNDLFSSGGSIKNLLIDVELMNVFSLLCPINYGKVVSCSLF